MKKLYESELDALVRKETAFYSLMDMCNHSFGSYTPTLRIDINPDLRQVAEAFNEVMKIRGSYKRAFIVE